MVHLTLLLGFNPRLVAVQAPTFDRADCPHCDTHRVLFGLECSPPQKTLPDPSQIPQLMLGKFSTLLPQPTSITVSLLFLGENFHFDGSLSDGLYLIEAGGINLAGQDVTISSSFLYPLHKS